MDRFIARQPILDTKLKVHAYELLFRSSMENCFGQVDGDTATKQVMANSVLLFGMESMTGQGKAFINFTRNLLIKNYALTLPAKQIVVEILENVEPDEKVIQACKLLKAKGYTLALDDFVFDKKFKPLIELADIIKVEYPQTKPAQRAALAKLGQRLGISLLAEKVETHEEFGQALAEGYKLFQGYFFSKPQIIARKDLPSSKLHYLQLLKEVNRPDLDFGSMSGVIGGDVSLSYKLLRYINSAAFGLLTEVRSIEQALNLLGELEVKKWISLVALASMCDDKPEELITLAMMRAKLAEGLAGLMGLSQEKRNYFLLGLFSLLDAMIDRPLEEILGELPLGKDIKASLMGEETLGRKVLRLVVAQERGDWPVVDNTAKDLSLNMDALPGVFEQAVESVGSLSNA
jgi:c-di-GMP-related signal transduction protein